MGISAFRRLGWVFVVCAACFFGAARADTVQYVYDELGRLSAVIDGSGVRFYTYDAAGNLLSVSTPTGSQVAILSISPGHGVIGSSVTITGTGFIADPAQNTVRFAGTQASVTSASASSIVAVVPVGAPSGTVSVQNANGTATSAQQFAIVVAPSIVSITPGQAPRGFVTRIDIAGSGLQFASGVSFSQTGISASITSGASDGRLPINLSVSSTVPTGSYGFFVTNAAGTASSGSVQVVVGAETTGSLQSTSPLTTVFMPWPALVPPSGSLISVGRPVTVQMP